MRKSSNETRAAKRRRYIALREQGVSQTEARLIIGLSRTTSWAWDREAGLNAPEITKAEEPAGDDPPQPSGLREHLERDVETGVLSPDVLDGLDDPEPAPTERDAVGIAALATSGDREAPSPGGLLIGVGQPAMRGSFGDPLPEGAPPPTNTSGRRGSAVRIHVDLKGPAPRMGSWSGR